MKKVLIGAIVILSLGVVGCNSNDSSEEAFTGNTIMVTKVDQRENGGNVLEDIYVTTDTTDTSEEQLKAIFNELNSLKSEKDEKDTFSQVILSDGQGNRLGIALELGGLETKLDSSGLNNNQFKLIYSPENENKLMMKE